MKNGAFCIIHFIRIGQKWLRFLWLSGLIISCSGGEIRTVLYTADCADKQIQLLRSQAESQKNAPATYILAFAGKDVTVIDNPKGNPAGYPPYDTMLYNNTQWHYLDTTRQFIRPVGAIDSVRKVPIMLFVDTATCTAQEFGQLYSCLKLHHKAMQRSIRQVGDFLPYQFGGIVYGRSETFVQRYAKNEANYFDIYPDGRIIHTDAEEPGRTITSSNGLSRYVLMPGKRILVNTPQISLDELRTYQNTKTHRSLPTDFVLQPDTAFHSR